MQTVKGLTVYFDVDETLILFSPVEGDEYNFTFRISAAHIRALKEHHYRGHKVVVWSAGGAAWAEKVVKDCELEGYVDLCLSKPSWFYDDKRADEFMPEVNRVYFEEYRRVGA